jgi:hypothetical protein
MTLPLVLHGVFPAVETTLAEPLEGEVRSVLLILRMLEASCLRLFLKFERFSSLKKCEHFATLSAPSLRDVNHHMCADARRHRAAVVWQLTVHHSR